VAGVALLIGLDFAGEYDGLVKTGFFAPRYEAVRRNTFEQSRAFNEGMAQELQGMWRDYVHTTSPDEKAAIRSLVQHRVAGYDIDNNSWLPDTALIGV
jgi:hypothetical protein